ncbi:MAG: DNA gyrase subunit A [Lentisphaeria bacterium]|nr:DNA gyrase subunit A [Lentisphaeria bacterium]
MSELENRDIAFSVEEIMHTAYLQYSLSVNVGRAIPDVRDGLKPVNRRILYAMKQQGFTRNHATVKCAKVVGDVIGNYHPHGDNSVYDALVRLAQDFSMRNPLINPQGNFGTIDGDPAAAYRYTECRLERLAEELLADIDKDTVDMMPTFDETQMEPTVLPANFPNLLVNGSVGIGVGMATNIPPHNLAEVINATVALMENPNATVDELMEYLPGPDYPTGAIIRGRYSLRQLYATGHGSVRIRSRAEIEEHDGRERIVITEIPYMVNKAELVKNIASLVTDKRVTGISDIRDETSDDIGIRIVVEIKRGAMGSVVLNQLYAHTQLETSMGCTMMVVDHNRPRVMNLAEVLQAYIDHRLDVITRRTQFELNKAQARAHILEGLLKAVANLDDVVSIIRASANRPAAAAALIERYQFSQPQVNAILDMRLYQLTGLAVEELTNEYNELKIQIDYLLSLLASREKRLGVIRDELIVVRDKYADPRRTDIVTDDSDLNIADLIPRHSCVITISNTGYIKRVPADTYRTQHRGGKGIIGMETRDDDHVEHLFNANSHDLIFFFTDRGFMYWLNVYEIPEGSRTGKGKAVINMIKIQPGEKIRAMLTVSPDEFKEPGKFLVLASRNGYIKKTELTQFQNLRRAGIRALMIEEDDDLIGAAISENGNEVLLSTRLGMACLFDQCDEEIRPMGRTARGVTGMRFKLDGDDLVGMEVIREHIECEAADEDAPETESDSVEPESCEGPQVLIVTSGGIGKRTAVAKYRKTHRGAKGVTSIKLRNDEEVIAALQLVDSDELLISTAGGQLVRIPAGEIRMTGRAAIGVRIMNLAEGDRIIGVAKLVQVEAAAATGSEETENGDIRAGSVVADVQQPVTGEDDESNE